MLQFARKKRSGSILSTKSAISSGNRYHEGRLLTVPSLPSPDSSKTYLFEHVIGTFALFSSIYVLSLPTRVFILLVFDSHVKYTTHWTLQAKTDRGYGIKCSFGRMHSWMQLLLKEISLVWIRDPQKWWRGMFCIIMRFLHVKVMRKA